MKTFLIASSLGALLTCGFVASADAHAKLVKSDPPAGGVVEGKKTFELTFNEEISGKLSGADIKDARGNKLPVSTMTDQRNKGLMVMLKQPLKSGVYTIDWRAVASDDGHRTAGSVKFRVN